MKLFHKYNLVTISILFLGCTADKELVVNEDKKYVDFYESGEVRALGKLKNNSLEGQCIYLYKNGDTLGICNFKNNKVNGIYKKFFKNNIIASEINYKDNIQNGKAIYYDSLTQNITEVYFLENDSTLHGKYYYYNAKTGSLNSVQNYVHGKLKGLEYKYFDSGKLEHKYLIGENGILKGLRLNENGLILEKFRILGFLNKEDSIKLKQDYPGVW